MRMTGTLCFLRYVNLGGAMCRFSSIKPWGVVRRARPLHPSHRNVDTIDALISWSGKTARFDMVGWGFPFTAIKIERASQDRPLEVATALRDQGITKGLRSGVHVGMSGGEILIGPNNLLGAMWLQLATAVEEDKRFRKCPARSCPVVWFEVSTGPLGVRDDAEFCSARCRHTAYRDRKTAARRLQRDGVSVKEIAGRFGITVAQARGWLRKPRAR